jgi:penicillin amidase
VLRPLLVAELKDTPEHRDLAALLQAWDGVDRAEQAAPLVYQVLYREVALGTFGDELGADTTGDMLATWYFWQQRFDALLAAPDSIWFDDLSTPDQRETLADVIRAAAPRARSQIEALQGKDPANWKWGQAHTLRFVSPLRRSGAGQELLGGFSLQRSGSGETLNRGVYAFDKPYDVNFFASMKVVVDFGDPDKIEAVLAGGVSERHLQPHQNDQARLWAAGERRAWWFDPARAEANARTRAVLTP